MKLSFKEFVLLESSNTVFEPLKKLLKDFSEETEKEEYLEEYSEKVKKFLERVINKVVKDGNYIEDKELIEEIKEFLKTAKISEKIFNSFLEASSDPTKREKFEEKIRSEVAEIKSVGKNKESKEDDSEETDKDIEKKAKSNAKDDDEFEKSVLKDIEKEKVDNKSRKVMLGIVDKEEDGEIFEAIIMNTDLKKAKEIEGLRLREDVVASGYEAKKLKKPSEVNSYLKKLKDVIIYWFYFDEDGVQAKIKTQKI